MMNLFWTLGLCFLLAYPATPTEAKQERSQTAKNQFKAQHPCPANGNNYGPCPGYVIDHIKPLACGGADAPFNMQWQSDTAGKAKDKWERQGCQAKQNKPSSRPSGESYYLGPKGGCYTYSGSGKKRYVAHELCGF